MWWLLLVPVALAQTIVYQATIQGGMSVDASGVATTSDTTSWDAGNPLVVQIPSGATIQHVYALVHAQSSGFLNDPASEIAINGVSLSSATLLTSTSRVRVYELSPSTYGITGSGSYAYQEQGTIESTASPYSALGVSGTVLAVVYTHTSLFGRRHVVLAVDQVSNVTHTITGIPTGGVSDSMLVSYGILWECETEQGNEVRIDGNTITTEAGGRDDGGSSCAADWNSLITQGSFGFSDGDAWIGTDGDDPDAEPASGTADNSRLSDELYAVTYGGSGSVTVYDYGNGSSWLGSYALVVEMDTDGDGTPDNTDGDADNDGVPNASDTAPYDPTQCEDLDQDTCDDCSVGVDGFGPLPDYNKNLDGPDSDGDGLCDAGDNCYDTDGDGYANPGEVKTTCTGSTTVYDNCPNDANPAQTDSDGDGIGDACDFCYDTDGDGYADPGQVKTGCLGSTTAVDNCPSISNPTQADADADGIGDACDTCTDSDHDGYADPNQPFSTCEGDNCPSVSNPSQADDDGDGIGDACDTCSDRDEDGFGDPGLDHASCDGGNADDNCPDIANSDQSDIDGDGIGDVCDDDMDGDGLSNDQEDALGTDSTSPDSDGDTISDLDEIGDPGDPTDTDDDGTIDALDLDSDADGVSDANEAGDTDLDTPPIDTDDDGTPDFQDTDSDDDGVFDDTDNCRIVSNPDQTDTDGNGVGDACDGDIDGDGVPNESDNCQMVANPDQADRDGNGVGDACEVPTRHLAGPGPCSTDPAGPLPFLPVLLLLVLRRRAQPAARRTRRSWASDADR